VQKEELDSCRAGRRAGPAFKRNEAAGRNRRGFSLRNFRQHKRGGRSEAPSWLWSSVVASLPTMKRRISNTTGTMHLNREQRGSFSLS
jgi:hypothetical protein